MNVNNDGFFNAVLGQGMLRRDPFSAYRFRSSRMLTDQECASLFTYNGIAQKIVTAPADEAVKRGFTLRDGDAELPESRAVQSVFEDLDGESCFSQALVWHRLYGGGAILIVAADGADDLSEPLHENQLKSIEKLCVYEAPDIQTSSAFMYGDPADPKYGQPEFYNITGLYGGVFTVHESRLLLFRGDPIPAEERRMRNYWGAKIYERLYDDLTRYDASLALGLMALSRLSQGILKLDGLAGKLAYEGGEVEVQKRMQLIDMCRHMMNTIALDTTDDYDQKNLSLGGVKDLLEEFQVALSAVTEIPVTVLFGRSPGGLNSTGKADFESFYNLVQRIQRSTLRPQLSRLIDLIGKCKDYRIRLPETYTLAFEPLWSPTEKEQAETKNTLAQAEKNRADARIALTKAGALDVSELRDKLEEEGEYKLDRSLDKDAGGVAE